MKTKGRKINDLARVTYLGVSDGIAGCGIIDLTLLGTDETLTWMPNNGDFEIIQRISPIRVGDEIAIEGFAYGDVLRRVRYSCRGRSFRGLKAHCHK